VAQPDETLDVDGLDVREAGDDKSFGRITGTWTGVVGAATLMRLTDQGSYDPAYTYSSNTFTYGKGSRVYLLDAPDGEVFIMQSFARHLKPTLREGDLSHLYRWLDLSPQAARPPAPVGLPCREVRPGYGGLV
jgi:hypothetical protein